MQVVVACAGHEGAWERQCSEPRLTITTTRPGATQLKACGIWRLTATCWLSIRPPAGCPATERASDCKRVEGGRISESHEDGVSGFPRGNADLDLTSILSLGTILKWLRAN